jgi:hypothetical protein
MRHNSMPDPSGRTFDVVRVTIVHANGLDGDGGSMPIAEGARLRWEGTYYTYGGGARPGDPRCNVGLETHVSVTEDGPWSVVITDYAHPENPHRIEGFAAPPAMIDAGGVVVVIIPQTAPQSPPADGSPDLPPT